MDHPLSRSGGNSQARHRPGPGRRRRAAPWLSRACQPGEPDRHGSSTSTESAATVRVSGTDSEATAAAGPGPRPVAWQPASG